MLPGNLIDAEIEELISLRVKAQYVQELQVLNMQKAIARAFGAED